MNSTSQTSLSDLKHYEGEKESKGIPVVDGSTGKTVYLTDTPATLATSRFGVYRFTPIASYPSGNTTMSITEILASSDWTLSGGNLLTCNTTATYRMYVTTHHQDISLVGNRAMGSALFKNSVLEGVFHRTMVPASSPGAIDTTVGESVGNFTATDTLYAQAVSRSTSCKMVAGNMIIVKI